MKRLFWSLALLSFGVAPALAQDRETVLDSLQYTGFHYFWDEANPANGLIRDRSQSGSPASIAANGFGFSAICIGIDHGWITRAQGRTRTLTTLQTFWNGPQGPGGTNVMGYKGLYYHFLDMTTGMRTWSSELSTIDTGLLFAGIVDARQYFTQNDPEEQQIRALADSILWRADWNWMRNGGAAIKMGWNPESGFSSFGDWIGYNEAKIMYILAIGSPTHPVPPSSWNTWTSGYTWAQPSPAEQPYVQFNPLFGHQYSECWVDFRVIQDAYMRAKGITYFENGRRATIAHKEFGRLYGRPQIIAIFGNYGYSDSLWGWTASDDGQLGYAVHGAPNGPNNNGTIAPTAAFSSYPFAPDSVWSMMRNMWNHYRVAPLWGRYGFTDAFNQYKFPWIDLDYLGIDQGPIVIMLENARNASVWQRVMGNPDIQRGLLLAGFTPPVSVGQPPVGRSSLRLAAGPNPFQRSSTIRCAIPRAGRVRLALYDLQGREALVLIDGERAAGEYSVQLDAAGLPAGVYLAQLESGGESRVRRLVSLP